MRVIHIDSGREWRGGQVQLAALARVVGEGVILPADAPLGEVLRRDGVRTFACPMRGWGARSDLHAWIRRLQPDLVAAHTSRAHQLALGAGVPVVVHRRVDFAPGRLSRRKYARAAGYVAVSEAVKGVLERTGVPESRIVVVPDGLCLPSAVTAVEIDVPRPWVLSVGALVAHKGHRVLLDALSLVPEVHLALAGSGPRLADLKRQAVRLGVASRVHFLGWRPDVHSCMLAADAVVHPSVEEGLGQSVLEALALGCPVVATRAGGVAEAVAGAGSLVRPGDPRALAAAIASVLAESSLWRSRARDASRRLAERFSVEAMCRDTRAAYLRWGSTSPDRGDNRAPLPC